MILPDSNLFEEHAYFNIKTIQNLDPLQADARLSTLPALNGNADTAALTQLLRSLAKDIATCRIESAEAALAAMRDIGIVAGSLKRHGIEPVAAVPEIEPPLIALGRYSNMIPRDTVHHYTSWNPPGERRRTYTGDEQERWLQDAVVHVFPNLSASLSISEALSEMDPRDARFAPMIGMLSDASRSMIDAIDSVTSRVSPVFFAQVMRPYFEEFTVEGTPYLGPAAAQAPLWLIDLCVWASDRNQPDYERFLLESVQYSLPPWRDFHARHASKTSLVTKVADLLQSQAGEPDEGIVQSASRLADLLYQLKVFRGRHIGIARRAYSPDVRLYDQGSGGAPVELLKRILDLTRENEALMQLRPRSRQHQNALRPASAGTAQQPQRQGEYA
ncbi:DUF1864 family protein [Crenobacter sp. SG2303]|uniref:DUF1864 family protein n=1 Tax=Crenobacter oryzisoli TaxID=3056844 RepID=A0ABT7XQN4_9NEIS|nr:monodechloroaminopyrrolnitrin synthase PrnB family protein [Crenobacter sp. SG2303]MDN0076113.1 DUF1864 family protein [Crenobacter sp. SG2303]